MKNTDQLTNEDMNRLVDFIVKPGGPADKATRTAIDRFVKEGIKSLVAVAVAGDKDVYLYVYQRLVDRVDEGMAGTFVPGSTEVN